MGSATGLDYGGVAAYFAVQDISGDALREAFAGIQAAERATLTAHAEKARAAAK